MYIYSVAISAVKGNKTVVTTVPYRHSSRDLDEVERDALEIAYTELPIKRGYSEHSAVVEAIEDSWILEAADFLLKVKREG
jgi:hypothetical protein